MAISHASVMTEASGFVFEDSEFEKEIRKKHSWWLPVALPYRLRDDKPSEEREIDFRSTTGRLPSDVALWLFELRHASDSDDLLTGLKLNYEPEDEEGDSDGAEVRTANHEYDSCVLSGDQLVGPDLTSADVGVESTGVVLGLVNDNNVSQECTEFDEEGDAVVNTGGGVAVLWFVNPSYTAEGIVVDVGGANSQCRGVCNIERESQFRKLCQSVLEELKHCANSELITSSSDRPREVQRFLYSISESDGAPGNDTDNPELQESEVAVKNLKNNERSSEDIYSSEVNKHAESKLLNSVSQDVCDAEPIQCCTCNGDIGTPLPAFPVNSGFVSGFMNSTIFDIKCDDVLHDLECMMHSLQGMEDSYSDKNRECVECQENQDVEFVLLCDNADNLITETLQCYKDQWIPSRKSKPISEASSNLSDDVFIPPALESDEINVFLNDTQNLKTKDCYHYDINTIFDDGTKPPVPPLRRKKKEKKALISQHDSDSSAGGCSKDNEILLPSTEPSSRPLSFYEYADSCCVKHIESPKEPAKCGLLSITMAASQNEKLPDEQDSQSDCTVLEVTVPQARPISSFEFPPCTVSERDENSLRLSSFGRSVKQRIRPVTSLEDFSGNVLGDSFNSLDRSRKGSGSSDIAAWKKDLQRSGFFTPEDDFLPSDEWFSSTDHEGRVYYFEENSAESSWTLPKISIDDSEVLSKKSLPEVPVDTLLRSKDWGKRSSRITKAHSLLATDKKQRESASKSSSIPRGFLQDKSAILKEGLLNRTKLTENGKKVRKNWVVAHVVLKEQFLLFYRDAKSVQPEIVMQLNEAHLCHENKMSKRKNVFLVSTANLQVLFQDDDFKIANAWSAAIANAICSLDKSSTKCLLTPSQDEEERGSPLTQSRAVRNKNQDGSFEDQMSSNEEQQTKIRDRLKRFFHRRPTREALVDKGIYKDEPVFDNYLEKVCSLESPRIPKFVQLCINAIEGKEENMKADGLYRASGNLSHVQKIRLEVDQNNLQVLEKEDDVHVLTGALKLFFRELKTPLIPFEVFNKALESGDLSHGKNVRIQIFQDIVERLPVPNRDTLIFLLCHLRKVTEYEQFNRMHIPNLAIVFGPTLIWREKESHQNHQNSMPLEYMQQNWIIEIFLQQFDEIFKKFELPNS